MFKKKKKIKKREKVEDFSVIPISKLILPHCFLVADFITLYRYEEREYRDIPFL